MTLYEATCRLDDADVPDSRYDARLLFIQKGGYDPGELVGANPDCNDPALIDAIERREKREPAQYIIGKTWFFHEVYKVTPDCLIPRPDTELLVDYARKHIPAGEKFLDLCTGSGCIAISVLCNTTDTRADAADVSEKALKIARENAVLNGVSDRVEFRQCDVMNERIKGKYFAILANPPYVTTAAYAALEPELYYEPKIALLGGDDGMDYYRRITADYRNSIGKKGFIAFEIGYDQAKLIGEVAEQNNMTVEIFEDICHNPRVAVLKKK